MSEYIAIPENIDFKDKKSILNMLYWLNQELEVDRNPLNQVRNWIHDLEGLIREGL
jgi:hypothetical protein